jgi:TM2 domain-containing membrane protein YozV
MRCPSCNGLNPDGAEWCGLCFTKFDEAKAAVGAEAERQGQQAPMPAPETPIPRPARKRIIGLSELQEAPVIYDRGFLRQQRKLVGWQCGNCGRRNSMDTNICVECGATLFASFDLTRAKLAAEEPKVEVPRKTRPPAIAAVLSVIPGLGQLYVGRIADGIARLLVAAWWIPSGLFLASTEPLRWVGILFLFAISGLVALSVADAYRHALNPDADALLTKQLLLYSNVALVSLTAFGGLVALFVIRR